MWLFAFAEKGSCRTVSVRLESDCFLRAYGKTVETAYAPRVVNVGTYSLYAGRLAVFFAFTAIHAFVPVYFNVVYIVFIKKPHRSAERAYVCAELSSAQQ